MKKRSGAAGASAPPENKKWKEQKRMIAVVDYGAGNLQSVKKALDFIGEKSVITAEKSVIEAAGGIILPGVGAFGDAMECMKRANLVSCIRAAALGERPFLGICLGLQLLFEGSQESPGAKGLGILKGEISKIPSDKHKVPHIGWNSLSIKNNSRIYEGLPGEAFVYFVHSYYLKAQEAAVVSATTEYAVTIDASVSKNNLFGVQFHPEKSGDVGLQMLRNFARLCAG